MPSASSARRPGKGEALMTRTWKTTSPMSATRLFLAVILAAGIAAALIALVPRLHRLASRQIRPHLLDIWANVKTVAAEPRKIVYTLAGSTAAGIPQDQAVAAVLIQRFFTSYLPPIWAGSR
jgi:hypothetical protein